eukprot:1192912-Prorocentrum_minimum.AAC.7
MKSALPSRGVGRRAKPYDSWVLARRPDFRHDSKTERPHVKRVACTLHFGTSIGGDSERHVYIEVQRCREVALGRIANLDASKALNLPPALLALTAEFVLAQHRPLPLLAQPPQHPRDLRLLRPLLRRDPPQRPPIHPGRKVPRHQSRQRRATRRRADAAGREPAVLRPPARCQLVRPHALRPTAIRRPSVFRLVLHRGLREGPGEAAPRKCGLVGGDVLPPDEPPVAQILHQGAGVLVRVVRGVQSLPLALQDAEDRGVHVHLTAGGPDVVQAWLGNIPTGCTQSGPGRGIFRRDAPNQGLVGEYSDGMRPIRGLSGDPPEATRRAHSYCCCWHKNDW